MKDFLIQFEETIKNIHSVLSENDPSLEVKAYEELVQRNLRTNHNENIITSILPESPTNTEIFTNLRSNNNSLEPINLPVSNNVQYTNAMIEEELTEAINEYNNRPIYIGQGRLPSPRQILNTERRRIGFR